MGRKSQRRRKSCLLNSEYETLVTYNDDIDEEWAKAVTTYQNTQTEYQKSMAGATQNYVWDEATKKLVSAPKHYQGKTFITCKHAPKWVTTTSDAGIEFYGATGSEIQEAYTYAYAFDLNRSWRDGAGAIAPSKRTYVAPTRPAFIVSAPAEFKEADTLVEWVDPLDPSVGTKFIDIAWPDMSVIKEYGRDAWELIAYAIAPGSDVLVACTGGHGRTGSFLAIIIGILEDMNGVDALQFVREQYCMHAVETQTQEEYIKKILGA